MKVKWIITGWALATMLIAAPAFAQGRTAPPNISIDGPIGLVGMSQLDIQGDWWIANNNTGLEIRNHSIWGCHLDAILTGHCSSTYFDGVTALGEVSAYFVKASNCTSTNPLCPWYQGNAAEDARLRFNLVAFHARLRETIGDEPVFYFPRTNGDFCELHGIIDGVDHPYQHGEVLMDMVANGEFLLPDGTPDPNVYVGPDAWLPWGVVGDADFLDPPDDYCHNSSLGAQKIVAEWEPWVQQMVVPCTEGCEPVQCGGTTDPDGDGRTGFQENQVDPLLLAAFPGSSGRDCGNLSHYEDGIPDA